MRRWTRSPSSEAAWWIPQPGLNQHVERAVEQETRQAPDQCRCQKDYTSLKGNSDLFERHLRQLFQAQFGKALTTLIVKVSFHEVDSVEICRVDVEPTSEPVFIKSAGREEFYARNGNATVPLEGHDLAKYLKQRFRG